MFAQECMTNYSWYSENTSPAKLVYMFPKEHHILRELPKIQDYKRTHQNIKPHPVGMTEYIRDKPPGNRWPYRPLPPNNLLWDTALRKLLAERGCHNYHNQVNNRSLQNKS